MWLQIGLRRSLLNVAWIFSKLPVFGNRMKMMPHIFGHVPGCKYTFSHNHGSEKWLNLQGKTTIGRNHFSLPWIWEGPGNSWKLLRKGTVSWIKRAISVASGDVSERILQIFHMTPKHCLLITGSPGNCLKYRNCQHSPRGANAVSTIPDGKMSGNSALVGLGNPH